MHKIWTANFPRICNINSKLVDSQHNGTFPWEHLISWAQCGNGLRASHDQTLVPEMTGHIFFWQFTPRFHTDKLNQIEWKKTMFLSHRQTENITNKRLPWLTLSVPPWLEELLPRQKVWPEAAFYFLSSNAALLQVYTFFQTIFRNPVGHIWVILHNAASNAFFFIKNLLSTSVLLQV